MTVETLECCRELRPVPEIPCAGPVSVRPRLVESGAELPFCDAHWTQQRSEQDRINALPPDD